MGKTRKPSWKLPTVNRNKPCVKCIDGIHEPCRGKGCKACNHTGLCECKRRYNSPGKGKV